MGQQKKGQDTHQILVCGLVAIATLSVTPAFGALFCPPAVANSKYTITAENYKLSDKDASQVLVRFSVESQPLLQCSLAPPSCSSFPISNLTFPSPTLLFTVADIGFDAFQVAVTMTNFSDNFKAHFEVLWLRGGASGSNDNLTDTCLVQTAGLVDECVTTNPCLHGSTCMDMDSGYQCVCPQGYNGINCGTGDKNLHCSLPGNGSVIWDGTACNDVVTDCFVGGLDDQTGLQIQTTDVSNKSSPLLTVNARVSETKVSFRVCALAGIAQGLYQILFELQSPKAVAPLFYPLIIEIVGPKFNKPASGYNFDVPEDRPDNSTIVTVYKHTSATCSVNTCIEVIDPDPRSAPGVNSLHLTVFELQAAGSIKFMPNFTSDRFGYFYTSGQLVPNQKFSFLLSVNVSGVGVDTAVVVFTITDINQPPVCSTSSVSTDVDIRTSPLSIVGSVLCTDKDTTTMFKEITYSLEGQGADYFRIDDKGTIFLQKSLMELSPGLLTFTAVVNGYNSTNDDSYKLYIPVNISITVPEPECNLTITRVPQTWKVNSSFQLKLDCDNRGIDKLQVEDVNFTAALNQAVVRQSPTVYALTLTVLVYVPGQYDIAVTASLGGPGHTKAVVIPMFNRPQMSLWSGSNISDTSPSGLTVLQLNVSTDIPQASVSWTLNSGDVYSMLTPHNGLGDITLILTKSVEQYTGQSFSIVLEARDSVSLLTAVYTWNFSIIDTNQRPVCGTPNTSNINSGMPAGTIIISVNCSDPDITPEFRRLSYNVTTAPTTVNLNISSAGDIVLVQPFPAGVTSFVLQVNVSDSSLFSIYTFTVTVIVVRCPSDRDEYGLDFSTTPVNTYAGVNCPSIYTGQAFRFCHLNQTWDQINYTRCRRTDLLATSDLIHQLLANPSNVTDTEVSVRIESLSDQLTQTLGNYGTVLSGDIKQMVDIMSRVGQLTQQYPGSTLNTRTIENFAQICDTLLTGSDFMWTQALDEQDEEGGQLVAAMDNLVNASLRLQGTIDGDPIVKKHIVIKRESTSEDIYFPKQEDETLQDTDDSSMFLGREAFTRTHDTVSYGIVLYKNTSDKLRINANLQNEGPLQDKVLNSQILSFTLNVSIPLLSPQLELSFTVLQGNYSNASCGYLNTRINGSGVWASDGCTATRQGDTVKCRCNHLTNFGVLMNPFGEIPLKDYLILSIISAVGCGISIFCLLMTVGVYTFLWKYVTCDRSVLHVNLSLCLILAYTLFLAGVDRTDSRYGCKIVAALLHYIYLVVFCIMLSEGVEIFRSVSFVFSSKSILWKLLLFSYGVPLIIVAISLGVTKAEGYGTQTSCWLSTSNGLIWAFVGPVLLALLINMMILFQVLWIMQRSRQMQTKTVQQRTKSAVRTVCVLSPILGLTWVFGVLSVNRDTIAFQYLFAILNSLQGLLIFILYCVTAHQVRDGFKAIQRKYRAKSFDSSQVLSPVSSNGKHSDSDTNLNRQLKTSPMAGSSSTIHTLVSDSAANGHGRSVSGGQSEASSSYSTGRQGNADRQQARIEYTNCGFCDDTVSTTHTNGLPLSNIEGRQTQYLQNKLKQVENNRAKQNWRRARDAVLQTAESTWPTIGASGATRYRGSESMQGHTKEL